MKHWASDLVGLRWTPEFNCWQLVRRVFLERFCIAMPEHAAGVLRLTTAAHESGWRPAAAPARADDIVLMRTLSKRRHVGVIVSVNRRTMVLHNDGCMMAAGPVGQVVLTSLAALREQGCRDFEFWRRA